MAPPVPRILVISLGNPRPYHNTFHSAGHHALRSLQHHLSSSSHLDPSRFVLKQCTTLMNVSGSWVRKEYERLLDGRATGADGDHAGAFDPPEPLAPGLVVLHDQIELPLGAVRRVERWNRSARGHNGMRDVLLRMVGLESRVGLSLRRSGTTADVSPGKKTQNDLQLPWARIEIGIGPREMLMRKGEALDEFVLRSMTSAQIERLAVETGPAVAEVLANLERRWWASGVANVEAGKGAGR